MREQTLAVLLLVAASLIVTGVAKFSDGAAFVVAGTLCAGWAWLFFGEVEDE